MILQESSSTKGTCSVKTSFERLGKSSPQIVLKQMRVQCKQNPAAPPQHVRRSWAELLPGSVCPYNILARPYTSIHYVSLHQRFSTWHPKLRPVQQLFFGLVASALFRFASSWSLSLGNSGSTWSTPVSYGSPWWQGQLEGLSSLHLCMDWSET